MAILIKNRLSSLAQVTASAVNAALGEVQAIFNRIGVVRYTVPEPNSDYFRFDKDAGKLYLVTIEGDELEVTLT